ncbi:hypothetical protein K501DRAFT_287483 [Backusella circina FSU 941]|nr:hypothetical protein K501DRAFT_287483 [Backusella circina FSU 941]
MGIMPPTTNSPSPEFDALMESAKELMARKDRIDEELRELDEQLKIAGIGMEDSLVDRSGFPRADIDVAAIRGSRVQILRLRNDHKDVMKEIENVLYEIHKAKRQQTENAEAQSVEETAPTVSILPVAFAIVNAVAPDSPADLSGLRRNDHILKFGNVHAENHNRLQALNVLISQSENQPVSILVSRNNEPVELTVTPRSGWGGRGTLGCHILPL